MSTNVNGTKAATTNPSLKLVFISYAEILEGQFRWEFRVNGLFNLLTGPCPLLVDFLYFMDRLIGCPILRFSRAACHALVPKS